MGKSRSTITTTTIDDNREPASTDTYTDRHPFAVVLVYGMSIGQRSGTEVEYVRKLLADHDEISYGYFGMGSSPHVGVYLTKTFTEIYDGFGGDSEVMMINRDILDDFSNEWDIVVSEFLEELGIEYSTVDIGWMVCVRAFDDPKQPFRL
jgi:hypothetical protein